MNILTKHFTPAAPKLPDPNNHKGYQEAVRARDGFAAKLAQVNADIDRLKLKTTEPEDPGTQLAKARAIVEGRALPKPPDPQTVALEEQRRILTGALAEQEAVVREQHRKARCEAGEAIREDFESTFAELTAALLPVEAALKKLEHIRDHLNHHDINNFADQLPDSHHSFYLAVNQYLGQHRTNVRNSV